MEDQGFSQRGTSLALNLRAHERNKADNISTQTRRVRTNEYRFDRRTCPGIQSVPTLTINPCGCLYLVHPMWDILDPLRNSLIYVKYERCQLDYDIYATFFSHERSVFAL